MRPRFVAPLVAAAAFAADAAPTMAQTCQQYDVTGNWSTTQGNGYHPSFNFRQSGTGVSGSATLPGGEATRAGYTGNTGSVSGSLNGDRLKVTVAWPPKEDGSTANGEYTADVEPSSASTGRLLGGRAGTVSWTGSGPAKCVRSTPKPMLTVVPPPAKFDTPVSTPAPPPGGAVTNASPPLGDAAQVTATALGLEGDEIQFVAGLKNICYASFVNALTRLELVLKVRNEMLTYEEKAVPDVPEALSNLAFCLTLVEAVRSELADKATARSSAARCRSVAGTGRIVRRPRRAVVGRRLRRPALVVSCKRVTSGLAITYRTRSGRPLRNVVGSRLRMTVVRSKRAKPGGTLTFGYHKGS